jgi:hypothetical protein
MVNYMNQVKAHYKEFPETPKDFEKWQVRTGALFQEAASKIMK